MNKLSRRTNLQKICGTAAADVIGEGMTPQSAGEKALKPIGQIAAKYPSCTAERLAPNPQTRFIRR